MSETIERKQCSSPELLDLWEHACLLFHSLEWQSAADTFRLIGSLTSDQHEKTLFLLCQGLIEARLGDLDLALETWKEAFSLDNSDPITNFLIGLLYAEIGDYANSHTHFAISIANIQDGNTACRRRGLDFALTATNVRRNVDILASALQIKETERDATNHGAPLRLSRIPANIMFEAPPRNATAPQRSSDEPERSPLNAKKPGLGLLTPRDAQVHYESMRDLARFIRHAGPNGEDDVTVDRQYMLSLLRGGSVGLSALDLNDHVLHSLVASGASTLGRSNDPDNMLDSHGVLNEEEHSDPTIAASMEGLSRPNENNTLAPNPREPPSSRQIAKDAIHRWLRMGARPPRRGITTDRQETSGSLNASSRSTASSTQKAASRSLPSVVSSLEVFKLGARRRRASPG